MIYRYRLTQALKRRPVGTKRKNENRTRLYRLLRCYDRHTKLLRFSKRIIKINAEGTQIFNEYKNSSSRFRGSEMAVHRYRSNFRYNDVSFSFSFNGLTIYSIVNIYNHASITQSFKCARNRVPPVPNMLLPARLTD